jgi:UDP-N-acetylglucosamine 2-epimerase (non-hydrolysing)
MIDTLHMNLKRALPAAQTFAAGWASGEFSARAAQGYAVLTLHRPSNVDDPAILRGLLETVRAIARQMPVVFPLHPRTRGRIEEFKLTGLLDSPDVLILPPLGYLQMLGLMKEARAVLTDSGGIQEETTALGVPCITLRNNTERPITVEEGTNVVVGQNPERILAAFQDVLTTGGKSGRVPEYWDGKAAQRIATTLAEWLSGGTARAVA